MPRPRGRVRTRAWTGTQGMTWRFPWWMEGSKESGPAFGLVPLRASQRPGQGAHRRQVPQPEQGRGQRFELRGRQHRCAALADLFAALDVVERVIDLAFGAHPLRLEATPV